MDKVNIDKLEPGQSVEIKFRVATDEEWLEATKKELATTPKWRFMKRAILEHNIEQLTKPKPKP